VFNIPAISLFLSYSPSVVPQSLSLDARSVAGGSGGSLPDAPDQEYRGRKAQRGNQEFFEESHGSLLVKRFLLLSISLLGKQDAK